MEIPSLKDAERGLPEAQDLPKNPGDGSWGCQIRVFGPNHSQPERKYRRDPDLRPAPRGLDVGRREQPESHRRYYCAACDAVVVVCRRCDRGQRYCGRGCSRAARRMSLRRAGQRYRRTPAGRRSGAERQRRHRRLRGRGVTHHGSADRADCVTGVGEGVATTAALQTQTQGDRHESDPIPSPKGGDEHHDTEPRCDFCGLACGRFTRFDFLPPPRRVRRCLSLPRDRPG